METVEQNHQTKQPEAREYLIIGAGKMGSLYLQKLKDEGIAEEQISATDVDPEKLEALQRKHPGISVGARMPGELPAGAKVFVVSNSPAHLSNLADLASLETPPAVLVEKPVLLPSQLKEHKEKIEKLAKNLSRGYAAYLINFSPAMEFLMNFMEAKQLSVMHGDGVWTKDRTGDSRPTAGNFEDEMTHQLAALLVLSRVNHTIKQESVLAILENMSFADKNAQAKLKELDRSVSLSPNSNAQLSVRLETEEREKPVILNMRSSFVSPDQKRSIEVLLSKGGEAPEYAARITFDDPEHGGDVLRIWSYPTKGAQPVQHVFSNADKLQLVTRNFLRAAKTGLRHPALKTLQEGIGMVQIAEAAEKSSESGSGFVLIEDESLDL